jgi:hypothetical protein
MIVREGGFMEKITDERTHLWDHAIQLSNTLTLVHAVEKTFLGSHETFEAVGKELSGTLTIKRRDHASR